MTEQEKIRTEKELKEEMEDFLKESDFLGSEEIPVRGATVTILKFKNFQESEKYGKKAVFQVVFDGEEKNISLNKTSCRNIALGVKGLDGYGTDFNKWAGKEIFLTKSKTQVGIAIFAYCSGEHYEEDMKGKQ